MNTQRLCFGFLFALLVPACDCGDDVKIVIISPEEGATFNLADDVDEGRADVQIVVQASTDGLDLGSQVQVSVDGVAQDPGSVGAGGVMTANVTLGEDGAHVIKVSAKGASDSVNVTLDSTVTECPNISITSPQDGETLTAADDTDEEPCGEFHYTVTVATDAQTGRTATLFVNDNSVATADVDGPALSFDDVTLDGGDNVLEVVMDGGEDCTAVANVTVDCGVTCTISDPSGDVLSGFEDDDIQEPGMQSDFVVDTDADDGQMARLVIDDDEPGYSASVTGGRAEFDLVPLAEGERTVQAVCRDAAGNEARSARVRYTVDTVAPDVGITEPHDNDSFNIQNDDADQARAGLQIQVCATSDEDNELCAAVSGADPGPDGCANVNGGQACVLVDCNGDDVVIEATTADDAGNVGIDQRTVNCDAGVPVIAIDSPLVAHVFSAAEDENAGAAGLQTTVVACVDDGVATVDLLVNGSALVTGLDVEAVPCQPPGGGELPNTATFSGVTLPEGEVTLVVIGQDGGGNVGRSPDVTVTVDSEAPVITFTDPVCGFGVVDTDDDGAAAGLQYDVQGSLGAGDSVVGASIAWEAGGGDVLPAPVVVGPFVTFNNVTFYNGINTITVDLIDTAGNTAQSTCGIRANEGGSIRITSPGANAPYPYAGDVDHGTPGFQGATVAVTSDGPTDGSMQVCVQDVGAVLIPVARCAAYTGPGTVITLTLPEGTSIDGGYDLVASTNGHPSGIELVSAAVHIRVDTIPPRTPTNLSLSATDVRAGVVRLDFTAPEDPSGRTVSGYQVRRATAVITNENEGTSIGYDAVAPAAPTLPQVLTTRNSAPGLNYFFAVRATDLMGNVGTSAVAGPVNLGLTVDTINSPVASADHLFGFSVAGGSDVGDDGYDDVVVGSVDFVGGTQGAYVYSGGVGGLGAAPSATLQALAPAGFGAGVALLDDFNGNDAFADVAVSDFVAETVWVWNGGAGLSGTLDTSDANVTITGTAGEFTGVTLSYVGDINNDGFSDLGIVASNGDGGQGVVYVVYGAAALPAALALPADADLEVRGVVAGAALSAVAPGGDVNGDNIDDLVVGACAVGATGGAYVIYGSAGLGGVINADADDEIASPDSPSEGYGCSIAGVGDVDGDGRSDVVVGARDYGADARGAFYLALPDGLGNFTRFRFDNSVGPDQANDALGYAIASTTGIGAEAEPSFDPAVRSDIAVAQYRRAAGTGRANLIWGRAAFAPADITAVTDAFIDEPAGSSQMDSLIFAGDVNGDGWVDLVAGDSAGSVAGVAAGRIYVIR